MFAVHDLAVLVAIADNGSVRRAAAVLGRTQPAVSQTIQRLEEAVGFALLDRSGYRARLTERGETFVKRARVAVRQARELQTFAAVLSQGVEARLRLVVHGAIPLADWLPLVKDMESRFPNTVLELEIGEGDAPMRRLMSDQADLAVVLRPAQTQHGAVLELHQMGQLEFVIVVHSSRLVSNLDDDLASLPQILVADYEDAATGYGIVEGHRYWRVSDHRIKAALIIAGKGWGSVPVTLVASALTAGTLTPIAYCGMKPRTLHPYFLCRKLERAHGPAASSIWASAARDGPG